jgi:DNA-binding NarL/FixJ family response regulator
MSFPIRVVIVDDHGLFRFGVKAILKGEESILLVGEFADCSVLDSIPQLLPDLMIVDLSLGKESGLDLIKEVRKSYPPIKILVMSMHKDEFHIQYAIKNGADGYLYKDDKPEELITAIKRIAKGETYYSMHVAKSITDIENSTDPTRAVLTQKEKEVIHFILNGHTSKEIGAFLTISARTVEAHRYNILNKLGLRNTTELVKLVNDRKLNF